MHSYDRLCFELDYNMPCIMLEYKAWLHSIYLGFNTWVMVQFVSNYKVAYGGWKHTLLHRKLAIPLHTKHGNTSILIANMVWKETDLCWVKIPPTHPCFIMRKNRKERASEKRKFKALKKALKKTTLPPYETCEMTKKSEFCAHSHLPLHFQSSNENYIHYGSEDSCAP